MGGSVGESSRGIEVRRVRVDVEGEGKVTFDPAVVRTLQSVKGAITLLNDGYLGLHQGAIFALPGDKDSAVRVDRVLQLELDVASGASDDDVIKRISDGITLKTVTAVLDEVEGGK